MPTSRPLPGARSRPGWAPLLPPVCGGRGRLPAGRTSRFWLARLLFAVRSAAGACGCTAGDGMGALLLLKQGKLYRYSAGIQTKVSGL